MPCYNGAKEKSIYWKASEKMKISTKGRYAIRFITDLAIYSVDDPVKIKDVAGRQKI